MWHIGVPPSARGSTHTGISQGTCEHLARLLVGEVLGAGVDAGRVRADLGDRDQHPAGQRALQGRLDDRVGVLVGAVAEHAHVHPVLDPLVAAGADGHVLQPAVDGRHQLVALAVGRIAQRLFHRERLVQQEQEAGLVLAADRLGIWCAIHLELLHFGRGQSRFRRTKIGTAPGLFSWSGLDFFLLRAAREQARPLPAEPRLDGSQDERTADELLETGVDDGPHATQQPSQPRSTGIEQPPPADHSSCETVARQWASICCGSSSAAGSAGQTASRHWSARRGSGHVHRARYWPSGCSTGTTPGCSAGTASPNCRGSRSSARIHSDRKAWYGANRSAWARTIRTSNCSCKAEGGAAGAAGGADGGLGTGVGGAGIGDCGLGIGVGD